MFCDDINMPELDEVESQPAVELLRQLLDHQVFSDVSNDISNLAIILFL